MYFLMTSWLNFINFFFQKLFCTQRLIGKDDLKLIYHSWKTCKKYLKQNKHILTLFRIWVGQISPTCFPDFITLISTSLFLRSLSVVNLFSDIIKNVTKFIKTKFKDPNKLKELVVMYQNEIYICIPWYSKIQGLHKSSA